MESFGEPTLLMSTPLESKDTAMMEMDDSFVPTSLLLSTTKDVDEQEDMGFGFADPTLLGDTPSVSKSNPSETLDESEFGRPTLLEDTFRPTGLLPTNTTASSSRATSPAPSQSDAAFSEFGRPTLLDDLSQDESQSQEFPDFYDSIHSIRQRTIGTNLNATSSYPVTVPRGTVKAMTFDGKSVLFRKKPKRIEPTVRTAPSRPDKVGNLLSIPIHRLMENLSRDTAARLNTSDTRNLASTSATKTENALWVDRYRPQRFIELVGDDRVHREVMAWVKEWDWCVFGNKKGKKRPREDESLDEWKRPKEKILLISGPPGLGKTTLAHVIAKHAGYSVFEINASLNTNHRVSDSRSAQIVDERIRPALESGSMVGSKKPTLMVIDEIDGATGGTETSGGFIHKLVQLIQEKPRRKGRKEPKAALPVLRPIVCICNDLYASSLAKLRPHARIVRMSRPNDIHLIKRLRTICDEEGMKVESRALSTLVGMAQGDMRGCLNTLQMIKSRCRDVTENVVRKATAGMKEADASQTTILNDLFTPLSKKRLKELGLTEEQESRYVNRLSRTVESSGALDRIAIGCFEHYANLRRHDGNFSRYLKANEWLSSYDLLAGEMRTEREYSVLPYLSYMLVPFYPLFQERGGPRVERPKVDWEHFTQMKTNEEIYSTLAKNLRSAANRLGGDYRQFANETNLHLEFAPFINRIISPPLKPVNSQVIKPEEKITLSRLVDIMVSLELRFVFEKSEEGQNMFRLEPPIDVFVTYDGKRAADIAISRFAVRQLVANEVDVKWINQQAVETTGANGKSKNNFFNSHAGKGKDQNLGEGKLMPGSKDVAPPKKRARKNDDIVEKVPTDFFGRPILNQGKSGKPSSKKAPVVKAYRVAYKFNEGNSAAVRKPVKVSAFL